MLSGNSLVKILIFEYFVIAAVYGMNKDWSRLVYWIGAIVLNVGILTMK
jgi:uncharacterized membrane protein YuzA (DUF378 family)